MADFEVDPATLREYAQVVDGLHWSVSKIDDYMRSTACDTSGFTGLFYVLRPVVDKVADLYGETLKFGHSRLASMSEGVQSVAKAYTEHEAQVGKILINIGAELDDGAGRDPGIVGTGGPGQRPPIGLSGSPAPDFPPISDTIPQGPTGTPAPRGTQPLPD